VCSVDKQASRLTPNLALMSKCQVTPCELNGSAQHSLEVYLQESQQLKSFVSVDSHETPPWLGLIEYSRINRGSLAGKMVGSTN